MNQGREPSADERKYSAYLRQRNLLDERLVTTTDRYEKALLALSGGAIAISLTFLEKIAIAPSRASVAVMTISWALLVTSVILGFMSLFFSARAVECARAENEDDYEDYSHSRKGLAGPKRPRRRWNAQALSKCVVRLSIVATGCLALGIAMCCLFAAMNLSAFSQQRSMLMGKENCPDERQDRTNDDSQKGSYTPERQEQEPFQAPPEQQEQEARS